MDGRHVSQAWGKLEEFLRQKEESVCEVGKASCSSEKLFTVVEGRACRGPDQVQEAGGCWLLSGCSSNLGISECSGKPPEDLGKTGRLLGLCGV